MTTSCRRTISFHLLVLIPLLAPVAGCRAADASPGSCTGPIEIRSQEDVAALAACRTVNGDVHLSGSGVVDTHGLEGLTSIQYLVVVGTSLRDLSGLSGLRELRGLTVASNPLLASMRGLESVRRLDGLVIEGNDSLASLSGLEGLERADEVTLAANPRLECVAALAALGPVLELDVSLETNGALAAADVESLVQRTSRPLAFGR